MAETGTVITVDEFVATKVLPQFRDVVEMVRELMRECAPGTQELISYGIPAWKGRKILAVISPTKKDITFSFSRVHSSRIGMGCCGAWESRRST